MKKLKSVSIIFGILLMISCHQEKGTQSIEIPTIYFGGNIVTMEGNSLEYVQAIVTISDKIEYVGTLKQAQNLFPNSKKYDLKGQTLLPGFIEPHLHPSLAAIMLQNEIIAPYDWIIPGEVKKGVQGQEAYQKKITESISANAKPNEIYFIWGYHQLWHGDLSREILNSIAGDLPVGIIHRSFHEIYLNDAAIAKLGIEKSDFNGNPQVEWEKGHFYEGGWLALVPKMAPILLEPESYLKGLSKMSDLLLQNGITTIAEPGFPSSNFDGELNLLMKEMENNPPYDVYLIPSGTQLYGMKGGNKEAMAFMETLDTVEAYNRHNVNFLPKQVKLFSDGAIYSQLMQMKDGYTDGHSGEWMTPLDLFEEQLMMYWNNDYKIHIHANGDLGQQMVIDLVKKAQKSNPRKDHRLTLHHMGYFDEGMALEMSTLGIEASVNPYYLWALADKYSENGLGSKRAKNLVALKYLTDNNIPLSFHSDFSMAPVEPLTLAWTAVNRVSSGGNKYSQEQRISVYDALKAITIDAARTLNLEEKIGSIKAGKTANFTLLKENPFIYDKQKLKDIEIIGTVYRGKYFQVSQSAINKNTSPKIVGGWSSMKINEEVKEVVDFVISKMNTNAKLEKIVNAKSQIVNGTNYDVQFQLENKEVWKAIVYKDLEGNLKLLKKVELK